MFIDYSKNTGKTAETAVSAGIWAGFERIIATLSL
jgi:hypothetical protein